MHEQANNISSILKESLHSTHQNSNHALTNDNLTLVDNQSHLNNNCSTTKIVEKSCENLNLRFSEFFASSRHGFVSESTSTTKAAIVLSYNQDRINNNSGTASYSPSNGVEIMSHKNIMLSFDQQHQNSSTSSTSTAQVFVNSETLMSPAEAPFGRRYAEISQFKNHPNVEW